MMTPAAASTVFARAAWIVDRSEVAPLLEAGSRKSNRGAKRAIISGRLFAILMIAAAESGEFTVARMVQIGTQVLSLPEQWQYGIRRPQGKVLSSKQLYTFCEALSLHLGTDVAYLGLGDEAAEEERERRRAVLNEITDRLVKASHVMPMRGSSLAIDETGIWSWAIGRRKPKHLPDVEPSEAADLPDEDVVDAREGNTSPGRAAHCPDAAWGVKTHKTGGKSSFFGFHANVLVRVPDMKKGKPATDTEPIYIERFRIHPANHDVVDSSLEMIRTLIAEGNQVRDLLGDRHYSYKKPERFAFPLAAMGVHQVLDLREDEHGVRDIDGMKFVDGWGHCGGLPDALVGLQRPGVTAPREEHEKFHEQIRERSAYALNRNKTLQADGGKTQWGCPAVASRKFGLKVGCPLREGTVEVARIAGLPIVVPPEGAAQTRCCTQKFVQVQPGDHVKHQQELYWGSTEWATSWARRTYVEGTFGNLKNPSTENIQRGFLRMVGLPMVTCAIAAAAVSYNIREYNNWLGRNGQASDHPLARETEWVHGHKMLTAEEAAEIENHWEQSLAA